MSVERFLGTNDPLVLMVLNVHARCLLNLYVHVQFVHCL